MDSNIDSSHFTVDQNDQSNYNDLLIEQEEEEEEDEEKLLEALTQFEQKAFEQKKFINQMDLVCIQSAQLPNTLNLCFQNLQKNLNYFPDGSQQIQNLGGQNLFQEINDFQKKAKEAAKTFGKLKSEYFMINEPIINKQISELNLGIIQNQNSQLEQICQKLEECKENVQNIKNQNNQLKSNFLSFQSNIFDDFQQKLLTAQADIDKSFEQIEETKKNQLKQLGQQKQKLADFQKKQAEAGLDSSEQKASIDQFHKNLINQQKSLQKWNKEYEQNQPLLLKVQAQLKTCSQLFQKQPPTTLQQINERVLTFQQIVDCMLDSNKLLSQLENTQLQLNSIKDEQQDLSLKETELSQSLTQTIQNESNELFTKVNKIRQAMETDLKEKKARAQAAEEKVKEVKISQNDRLFIQKELARQAINIEQIANQLKVIEDLTVLEDVTNFNNLKKLKKIINDQEKLKVGKVDQVSKGVESVEQFLLKSVKNKVNEENKTTQTKISKLKRGYDEFLKKYEQVMQVYNTGVENINDFQEKYKINLTEIVEQLSDEFLNIFSKKEEQGQQILINKCLTYEKRFIIEQVNSLVMQFNEITQLLRDSQSSQLKSEDELNQIVLKNQSIQTQTKNVEDEIETAKKEADNIIARLNQIVNPDILKQLEKVQQEVSSLADECRKLKNKIESDILRNEQALNKINDNVDECRSKLELFNPLSNKSIEAGEENQNILGSISDLMDETNNYMDDLQNNQQELNDYKISVQKIDLQQVLQKMNSSQSIEDGTKELEGINKQLKQIQEVLGDNENKRNELGQDVNKSCKKVRDLVDGEISKNLKKAQSTIQEQDAINQTNQETIKQIRFKIKYLLSEILDADKNFGQKDQQFQMKLEMATLKAKQIEDQVDETEQIVSKQKQRKNEAIRTLEECKSSSLTKNSVIQIENLLQSLKEQQEGNNQIGPQLQEISDQIISKTKEIEDLLEAYSARQGLQDKINQIEKEIEQEFQQVRPVLDKLPNFAFILKRAVSEMLEGAQNQREKQEETSLTCSIIEVLVQGGDYDEKKVLLDEQLEELNEIQEEVHEREDNWKQLNQDYKDLKNSRDHAEGDRLKKRLDDFNEIKNAVSDLLTGTLNCNEQLEDLKKDIGDCDLAIVLTKRKNQISQFLNRFERAKKDNFYMKKAFKTKPENKLGNEKLKFNTQKLQEKLKSQMTQLDTQLKEIENEKTEIETKFRRELEKIDSQEFDDFNKNYIVIKKLRDLKKLLTDNELKLKETEELQKEIMRKLSEQDLENSTDVLVARANGLKERLSDAKKLLVKIKLCGEQMDGNTSNRDEEQLVQALGKEMPEVLFNIDNNLKIIGEVEGMAKEIKVSLNAEQFENLKQKVQNSQDNADECEALIIKLEKDLVEWNAQKKIIKRDIEIEEIQNLFHEIQEDLSQEKNYTETELDRNRTKQNENRDQEMVDKDGNKVNIMEDLIRLEGQLQSYLTEVTEIENNLLKFEPLKDKLIEEFNSLMPDIILEERKKRNKLSQAAKMKQLKRPPQLLTKTKQDQKSSNKNEMDLYKMLEVNAQFRKPSKELIIQLKSLHQTRKELEEKYAAMRREVFKIKQIKLYKPVIGDVVDEMFAGYLNKANLAIEVQRISAKNYMFGTKKILANIVNDRLVIRVGGGFMNVEEFIEQYGKIEMLKLIKAEEKTKNEDLESPGLNQTFNKSAVSLQQQVKDKLRDAIVQSTPKRSGGPRQSIQITQNDIKSELRKTLTSRMGLLPRQSVNFGSLTSKGEVNSLDNSFQGPSKPEVRNSMTTLKAADLASTLKSIPKKF